MVRFLRNSQGATLIEQLITLLLGSVIVTSLYGFFRSELFHLVVQETKSGTLQDARGALDIMIRDLKQAGSWGTGNAPPERGGIDDPNGDADTVCNRLYIATSRLVHIQMDLNGNNNCSDLEPRENIRYELTLPTRTCPGPNIIRRNGDCLVANVTTVPSGKLFTFFDENGVNLGESPQPAAVKRIGIAFSVQTKHPDPKIADTIGSSISSSVQLRN